MLKTKQSEFDKFDKGLKDLKDELKKQEGLLSNINKHIKQIRENDAEIGKIEYSVKELKNFNNTCSQRLKSLESGEVSKDDMTKLTKLKKSLKS